MRREKNFSGFMGQTLELIGANAGAVALYLAVIGGLTAVGVMLDVTDRTNTVAGINYGFIVGAADTIGSAFFDLGMAVLSIIASYFLIARFLESQGRLPDRSTRIWAYVGMSILAGFGIVLGLLLLLVRGILLMVRWSAASGFLIGARTGITEALGASWEATKGHSWSIFFAALVLFIVLVILAGVVGGAIGFIGIDFLTALISGVTEALGNVLTFAFGIGVYTLVHDDSRAIGEVFS